MTRWIADDVFAFTANLSTGAPATHDVHVGGNGPPILILQELPGIGKETLHLAAKLNADGFRVYLPHLFGPFGRTAIAANAARLFCVRREFNMFLRGKQSPVAAWMRALVADIDTRENGAGVGVIGMCLTGSFALTLMAEDAVRAGVASQPALPAFGGDHLHMTPDEAAAARAGMEAKGPGLAMRYAKDPLSPPRLMAALKAVFGDALETMELPGRGHSILTLDFSDPAYARVSDYFRERFA